MMTTAQQIATAIVGGFSALGLYLVIMRLHMSLDDVAKAHDADMETETNPEPEIDLRAIRKTLGGWQ